MLLLSATQRSHAAPAWRSFDGYRQATLAIPAQGKTGFTEIPSGVTSIAFTNRLSEERSITNQVFLNGSGVAAGDVDGDGLCDLYFGGLDSANALYRNLGNWRFEDITAASGAACADQASTGVALVDTDGDGDLDLLVNGITRGTRLFLNDGRAHFREVTESSGLRNTSGSTSLALADVDSDGDLDLYVVNYRNDTMRDMPDIRFRFSVTNGVYSLLTVDGQSARSPEIAGRFTFDRASGVLENGEADVLFRNDGRGHFIPAKWSDGTFLDEDGQTAEVPYDWGLSAIFRDLNGDGAPDLYVCNDFQSPERVWTNDGQGRFRAITRDAFRQWSLFSMGVDVADIDRDGLDDIFVADMLSRKHERRQVQVMDATAFAQFRNTVGERPQFSRNTLFHQRGNGTYAEIAQLAGVHASDWSWCPVFLDVDLDGYEDLLITTGHWRDAQHVDISREIDEAKKQRSLPLIEQLRLRKSFPRLDTPNAAFLNRGDLTFEDASVEWGFDSRRISQGMALADLDGDGDQDVIVNCLNDGPLLYRNESSHPRVAVRLRGQPPNTGGIGAKVRVIAPELPPQSQEIIAGGRYLSSDDAMRTFAVRRATDRVKIEVSWRSGRKTVLENIPANYMVEVPEPATIPLAANPEKPAKSTFFEDVSTRLGHLHQDEPFDDFARQPLLPHKLSDLGPGVAWFDFNADGWDDLIIGAGRGGKLAVYRNDGEGGFIPQKARILDVPVERDLTTILGWRASPTDVRLLIGMENYETPTTSAPGVRQISLTTGEIDDGLLPLRESPGPLAMADIDRDGDLDLFVGGRVIAGRYPEAASSYLLRNGGGRLRVDAEASLPFAAAGLVSGAVFTDLDADGWPELVLTCEWGPIKIFKNERGSFRTWDAPVREADTSASRYRASRISQLTGWWNSVAVGDFDSDGRLDLVAGNWGRNTSRSRHLERPVRLYYGSVGGSRDYGLIEAHHDSDLNKLVPARDLGALSASFPMLQARFPTFTSFSAAAVSDVLSAGLPTMSEVSAVTLDSVLLLNREDHFEVRPLPIAAQVAPAFGIAVGDLDGDGFEDLFLAQNFFGVSPSESRHDAGCGLWLRGDGRGGFTAVDPADSGIEIYGKARGAALADFDQDGRVDLVVGQNRGLTKLFRNANALPGLRVRLEGSDQNPNAIGAVLRLQFRSGKLGPARELHLGSGYWSQDSAEVILGLPGEPATLMVRWPDSRIEKVPVPAQTKELTRRWSAAPGSAPAP